jgi:glutamate N-acetyltransferase/amino-acid N-acetyltransferase
VGVTDVPGFVASAAAAGVKASGDDLALVAFEGPELATAAGIFTQNRAAAAPVLVSRAHLARSGGRAKAVVLSSGNANACTGAQGYRDASAMCESVAGELGVAPWSVLVCSTGLIGFPLPLERILAAVPGLVASRGPGLGHAAARAIMTTDTVAKEVTVDGEGFRVGGMAKGAAMLAPNMATMLAVLVTDAAVDPATLSAALVQAGRSTFNRISVDGCTSTNDTVLALASGTAGEVATGALEAALTQAAGELARAMVADAEGGTRVAEIVVEGAESPGDAELAVRRIASSALVKCSLNGADPYWGRLVSEAGSSGAAFELDRVRVCYGGIEVCRDGVGVPHDAEAVRAHMAGRVVSVLVDLGLGVHRAAMLTSDLSEGYIVENRGTS